MECQLGACPSIRRGRAHGACMNWDRAAAQRERKARGGGDAVPSLTTSNAAIALGRCADPVRATPMRLGRCADPDPFGFRRGGASASLPLLDDGTASPASRRLASASATPGTRPLLILGQAPSRLPSEERTALSHSEGITSELNLRSMLH